MFRLVMNKKAALCALVFCAGGAFAADGSIHFTGSIADQTCSIDTSSQSQEVVLGKIAKNALNGAVGQRAAATQFSLMVKSCPATITGAKVKFDGTGDSVNPNLLALDNVAGSASGVAVQIADRVGTEIPLHSASAEYPLVAGTNKLDFIARYVSTATAVTVGTANATTQFTIVYK